MPIAHKIALEPTDKQTGCFARAAGTARFACNWALAEWQRQYAEWKREPKVRASKTLPLSVRSWTCPDCGAVHGRDVNAAKNLEQLAARSAVTACGKEGSGAGCKTGVKPASMKQEPNAAANRC